MNRLLDFLNSTAGAFLLAGLLYLILDWREITKEQPSQQREPVMAVICGRCNLVFYSLADYYRHVCRLEEPQSSPGNVVPWPTEAGSR